MWSCPGCQAKVDERFDICWRCGTSDSGEVDPSFARDEDVVPSSQQSMTFGDKTAKGQSELEEPGDDVVVCYWARNCNEAMFLANQLKLEGIPATADTHELRAVFAGFWGLVPAGPYFGARVWAFARDLLHARSWLAEYEQRLRNR